MMPLPTRDVGGSAMRFPPFSCTWTCEPGGGSFLAPPPVPARATDAPNEDGFLPDATLKVDLDRDAAVLASPRICESLPLLDRAFWEISCCSRRLALWPSDLDRMASFLCEALAIAPGPLKLWPMAGNGDFNFLTVTPLPSPTPPPPLTLPTALFSTTFPTVLLSFCKFSRTDLTLSPWAFRTRAARSRSDRHRDLQSGEA
mmetsp:Transcript_12296/g.30065  ORF Transcript_12296/g.30065 Transcript_12296/m.30065 type:complete len:201 (-) Transcript_12296:837-1439(-)